MAFGIPARQQSRYRMSSVLIRLRNIETPEAAEKLAEAIRNSGGIRYTEIDTGDDVNVTVGDVSVENA